MSYVVDCPDCRASTSGTCWQHAHEHVLIAGGYIPPGLSDEIASLRAELEDLKRRNVAATRTLIAAIGADGPENVDEAATRIVERLAMYAQHHGGHLPTCGGMDTERGECGCGYLQGQAYRELRSSLDAAVAFIRDVRECAQSVIDANSHRDGLSPVIWMSASHWLSNCDRFLAAHGKGETNG